MNARRDADRHAARPPRRAFALRAGEPGGVRGSTGACCLAPGIGDIDLHRFGSGRLRQGYCICLAVGMRGTGIDGARCAERVPCVDLACGAALMLPPRAARSRIGF